MTACCFTKHQDIAKSVGVPVMIEPDEVMVDLKAEEERLEALIQRSIEQKKDIRKLNAELDRLEEDIAEAEAEAISSEQVET